MFFLLLQVKSSKGVKLRVGRQFACMPGGAAVQFGSAVRVVHEV